MKSLAFLTILIGAAAATMVGIGPAAAAEVRVSSVYYQPPTGSATRQPRTASAGHLEPIPGSQYVPDPNISTSTVSVQTAPDPDIQVGSTHYVLAYVDVTGGAAGPVTVFPDSNPPLIFVTVPVQSPPQDIVVENVYFPVGGGHPCPPATVCGSGVAIDEFNESTAALAGDTFVSVFVPPTATTPNANVSLNANVYGSVDTTNASVRIEALDPPLPFQNTPIAGLFDRWVSTAGGAIGSDKHDLQVDQGVDAYALALYHATCPDGYYWHSSATVSQCSRLPPCPAGQVFNTLTRKCMAGCPAGEVCNTCPQCKFGCGLVTESGRLVWACFAHPLGSGG